MLLEMGRLQMRFEQLEVALRKLLEEKVIHREALLLTDGRANKSELSVPQRLYDSVGPVRPVADIWSYNIRDALCQILTEPSSRPYPGRSLSFHLLDKRLYQN